MTLPRVSIITPSYNQADYLELTIRSVLGQDYPELEYLIIDGGSSDGSVDIIQKYAHQLAWWVSEPDRGQAEAINKGFQRATGEIVAWLNSDDMYAPGAVRQAVEAFQHNPRAGMVYGDAVSIDSRGRPLNDLVFTETGLEGLAAFHIICQPAVFMRRNVWEQVGGLDVTYDLLLDHHLWLRIAKSGEIQHIPEVLAFARHHPAAKNVALAGKFGQEAYRIVDWMSTQPGLDGFVARNRRRVWAAAHRFNARYLLDGGQSWQAFKTYMRALLMHPPTALQEWQRMLYAGLSTVGLKRLGGFYYSLKRRRLPASMKGVENVGLLFPEGAGKKSAARGTGN